MPEYMMIMKGPGGHGDWQAYINRLISSGLFRGGSVLGNGECLSKQCTADQNCSVTGFMRFEADSLSQVRELIAGNPDYEAGGQIELLELIEQ